MYSSGQVSKWGFAVIAIALLELGAHVAIRRSVPTQTDWQEAAAYVREQMQDGDRVVGAPAWSDPLVREVLGDRIGLDAAGASDLEGVRSLWVMSIGGARSEWTPIGEPTSVHPFGHLIVERWAINSGPSLFDFVGSIRDARVEFERNGETRPCLWSVGRFGAAGLGKGAMKPKERFICDRERGWLWVGATVMEDLALRPRRCIWQHPAGHEPVRVTFHDVPRGAQVILYAGVYNRDERDEKYGLATLKVLFDGRVAGDIEHRDGLGWQETVIDVPAGGPTVDVAFETRADDPTRRSLCWSASMRGDAP